MRHFFHRILFFVATSLALIHLTGPVHAQQLPAYVIATFGAAPAYHTGPLKPATQDALDRIVAISIDQSSWDPSDTAAFDALAASPDTRVVWLLTDMMRFTWRPELNALLSKTATQITGRPLHSIRHRAELIDHMTAWDIPSYPGYLAHKRIVFVRYVPEWDRLIQPGEIDWHLVSWGGVDIDARPYDTTDDICHCIPAIDNPTVSTAAQATWLNDDDIIFGIGVNGAYRAYPRQIMEVREMVNDTLGRRDLGIPYCTLCGAAQAYFTDGLPAGVERPILRTSGLLSRSNKVMYDLTTFSVFDTFLGHAVTGPLAEKGIKLEQAAVVTTDWATWKAAHPETTVLLERYALGRDPDFRNGRDANGPIFPVGDVDPRLPIHEDVIGVVTASGAPVAFQRSAALAALLRGSTISVENVRLVQSAGGIKAVDASGNNLGSHQAFWFAWSQFYPNTVLWAE